MPKTVTIKLGDSTYTITELRSRDNAAWRAKLEGPFTEIADMIEGAPEQDLTDAQGMARLIRSVSGALLRSPDTIKGLLCEYAAEIDTETLDNAYDSEILGAFVEILKLAYPFGIVLTQIRALGSSLGAT